MAREPVVFRPESVLLVLCIWIEIRLCRSVHNLLIELSDSQVRDACPKLSTFNASATVEQLYPLPPTLAPTCALVL